MSSESATATDSRRESFVPGLGRYFPESLTNALLLAVLALLVTIPFLEPITQLELFGTGFFELFTLQMFLILYWVLGGALVESPRVGAAFDRVADVLPTSQRGIIYTTTFLTLVLGWINWALGLVGGILVGQRPCQRARAAGTAVHYPLVLTGGLLALVLMNQGLSSPGGLIMADDSGLANVMLDDVGTVAMSEFLLHPVNLVSSIVLVLTLPLVLVLLAPSDDAEIETIDDRNAILEGSISETLAHYTPAIPREDWEVGDRLENAETISLLAGVIGVASFGWHFATGSGLSLPWLLFTLMILGLLVQGPPMAFRQKTEETTRWANHVAIPFLLYAGVWALFSEANLYGTIGDFLAGTGLPAVAAYVVAFVLGLLVPDPGSVWMILGPAVAAADVDLVSSLVATMYGAGISNLWLGFLFASILSIRGFDIREFVTYATVVTVYVSVVVLGLLLIL